MGRNEALAELALRYFAGHGPATERDLAYWATLSLTEVRAGLSAVADQVESFEHDGRTFWFRDSAPVGRRPEPRGHLLQMLDEYYRGDQDSRWTLDVDRLTSRGREYSAGIVIVVGQFVGDSRRTVGVKHVTFEFGLRRDLADEELTAIDAAAHRYGRFLDLDPSIVITPVIN